MRLNLQLDGLVYGITDQHGRQVAHRRRPRYGLVLGLPVLLLGIAGLAVIIVSATLG